MSFVSSGGKFESALLHVRDEKASGTDGGTFTSGAWQTRVLNTVLTNEISSASLSTNTITLPSGTYFIDAACPAGMISAHKAKLYNTSDSTDVILGSSEHAWNNSYTWTYSFVRGRFTISSTKNFQVQHRAANTYATSGFGTGNSQGTEVYSDVRIWKVA